MNNNINCLFIASRKKSREKKKEKKVKTCILTYLIMKHFEMLKWACLSLGKWNGPMAWYRPLPESSISLCLLFFASHIRYGLPSLEEWETSIYRIKYWYKVVNELSYNIYLSQTSHNNIVVFVIRILFIIHCSNIVW